MPNTNPPQWDEERLNAILEKLTPEESDYLISYLIKQISARYKEKLSNFYNLLYSPLK